jgi:hypothetical protein
LKKVIGAASAALALAVLLPACGPAQNPQLVTCDAEAITTLVETFGSRLQNVSLQSPYVVDELKAQYAQLVDPSLLEEWAQNPAGAPGRTVSSPWPDRIEVSSIELVSPGACAVSGDIIEVTSLEVVNGGEAARLPVSLSVHKVYDGWVITGYAQMPQ